MTRISSSEDIKNRLCSLFDELLRRNGYGQLQVDVKLLRRGQKEVVLRCGKEYRFVVDFLGWPRKQEFILRKAKPSARTGRKTTGLPQAAEPPDSAVVSSATPAARLLV